MIIDFNASSGETTTVVNPIVVDSVAPTDTTKLWFDTNVMYLKSYITDSWSSLDLSGSSESVVLLADTAPTDTKKLWFDTSTGFMKAYHNNEWVAVNDTIWVETPAGEITTTLDPFGDTSGVALYNLDNNATDVSGNYNGTETGTITYTTGKFGSCIVNDAATDGYIDTPVDLSGTHTSSIWFKSTYTDDNPLLDTNDARHYMRAGANGVYNVISHSTNLNDGVWHHLCYVKEVGVAHRAYVDGVYIGDIDQADNMGANLLIGKDRGNSSFIGSIDQVRIFNRALTDSEVLSLYNEFS